MEDEMAPDHRPDLVVLDLDGTLVDLRVDWGALRKELRAELARRRVETEKDDVFGMLRELRDRGEQAAFVACSDIVMAAEAAEAPRAPVNRVLLDWLPDGVPIGILSLNSNRAVHAALRGCELPGPLV